jgi:hypothetical protein
MYLGDETSNASCQGYPAWVHYRNGINEPGNASS